MVRFFERMSAGSQPIQQPGRRAPKSPSAATPEASIVRRVFGESLPSLYGDLIATGVTHACLRGSSRFTEAPPFRPRLPQRTRRR